MGLIRVVVDVPDTAQTIADSMKLSGAGIDAGRDIAALASYLQAAASGRPTGAKVKVNVGGVQAINRVTFASFADADYITLNGVTLTGKTSPSGNVQFAVGASDQACSNNAMDCINACTSAKVAGTVVATRRATHTLSSFASDDTVTINGVIFTGKTTPTNAQLHFAIGSTDTITAQNLAALLNRADNPVPIKGITASAAAGVVTLTYAGTLTTSASAHDTVASDMVDITAVAPGTLGNLFTLAISAHGSVTGANFASGAEGTEASVTISAGR